MRKRVLFPVRISSALALVLALASTGRFLVCKISHELVNGLEPNLHGYNSKVRAELICYI